MKRRFLGLGIAAGLLSLAPVANAAIVQIDLTNAAFAGAQGVDPFGPINVGGVSVMLDSLLGGNLSFNGGGDQAGCAAGNPGLHNLACAGDGIGIGDDEVTFPANAERLGVSLNGNGQILSVLSIEFLDLFNPEGGAAEFAQYSINGGPIVAVASASNAGGYVLENGVVSPLAGVLNLIFATNLNSESDFAVARITVNAVRVPEPASLGLLGAGLIGLGLARRRRRA